MKKAYVFPGQGSQFSGMGRPLYEGNTVARAMFERANEVLGFRITEIMFEGSDEALRATDVTQPSIFLHSVILAATLPDFRPDMVAGHSLGEFSALAAAGAMTFEDALRLVAARARAMQRCCEAVPGAMAAVIGLPNETVEEVCARVDGLVIPANYNSPGQVVISGEQEAVAAACAALKEAGAKRALPLPVSGAFHSPLMEPARVELAAAIEATPFQAPRCPVYQNVSAQAETEPEAIKENLLRQLTSPVRWTQSVGAMLADGATEFIETGPGSVLQGLVKRIAPTDAGVVIRSAETPEA
ncbi:MAG: ACP S-malonyltransferase [Bacteroidales bacterium]|nr:ACP S-malonyltransferase [Bacteroidales bacterium]